MRALATIQRGQECIGHEYTTARLAYDYDFQSSSSYDTCKLMIRLRIFTQLREICRYKNIRYKQNINKDTNNKNNKKIRYKQNMKR